MVKTFAFFWLPEDDLSIPCAANIISALALAAFSLSVSSFPSALSRSFFSFSFCFFFSFFRRSSSIFRLCSSSAFRSLSSCSSRFLFSSSSACRCISSSSFNAAVGIPFRFFFGSSSYQPSYPCLYPFSFYLKKPLLLGYHLDCLQFWLHLLVDFSSWLLELPSFPFLFVSFQLLFEPLSSLLVRLLVCCLQFCFHLRVRLWVHLFYLYLFCLFSSFYHHQKPIRRLDHQPLLLVEALLQFWRRLWLRRRFLPFHFPSHLELDPSSFLYPSGLFIQISVRQSKSDSKMG